MSGLTSAERGRVAMHESTKILQFVNSYSDARKNSRYSHDGVPVSSLSQAAAGILVARELEKIAKRHFDAAKHENIVNVGGLRPMTEAEYDELKKWDTK